MNKWVVFLAPLSLISWQVAAEAVARTHGDDLSPTEYNSIERALLRGDERALPSCVGRDCPPDVAHLLKAASFRIRWDLTASIKEAKKCLDLSDADHTFTNYTCARLINSNSANLYGYYGYWSTIDTLARSIRRGYNDGTWNKLWKVSSPASSNPVIKSSDILKGRVFKETRISYTNGISSIPLIGDGSAKHYTQGYGSRSNVKPVINYPSAYVKVNGKSLLMLIDTGATATTLHASAAEKLDIAALDSFDGGAAGITGAKYVERIGVVKKFDFANITLRNMIVHIDSDDAHSLDGGVIGLDIISKLPPFVLTKNALLLNHNLPDWCKRSFTVSSDLYSASYGLVAGGSRFNNLPVVAVLDSGNAAAAISPTWGMVKRDKLSVSNRSSGFSSTSDGLRELKSGQINGTLVYLGRKYSGLMYIGANYNNDAIDFNIGMPYFYGRNLYVDFDDMKMCVFQ